ncbi:MULTISPECIES: ComEC/Rec2 family competence protein [Rhodomicrobium]|uniref:ComEC/Rec2 family competence protein n=1 Tax=Rhodomicrobium TaxID=1068 RepID=UPI000B4B592A|nr:MULTISPECIES: ComEC/Rec2 family competence protein [Rhodomicrobium]
MSLSEAAMGSVAAPPPGGFGWAAPPQTPGVLGRLEAALDAERGRWFLWLPVLFGLGIALYLGAPDEPPLALAIAAAMIAIALRLFFRLTTFRLIVSSTVLMVAFGFLNAKLHALAVDAPALQRTLRYVELEGWVERAEMQEKRVRLTIRPVRINGLAPEAMPGRVRISQRGKGAPPETGDAVRLRATLMPPPEPTMPGGFDFGRYYWFSGFGASGYVTGKIEPLAGAGPAPWDLRLRAPLERLRHAIAARVGAALSGDRGAIAKALIMGEGGQISEKAWQQLRDSGLAHVISISGLHMALTAGAMFWLIRALLALFPAIALRFPIKIWAAVGALIVASLYLAISGSAVTAVRSYIMIAIIFIAVILNRPAISQRNLAFSALLILIVLPQSLTDAGFQMSFAATAALIAFYEARPAFRFFDGWPGLVAVPLMLVVDAAMTTLLASAAVDPLAAYHFHRLATYSVIGNVLSTPFVSLLVMPMALVALVAMPFGLDYWPLMAMDKGIEGMLGVAAFTAGLPGAAIGVPSFAEGALPLMMFGGLWLVAWRGRWRWAGLAAVGAGLALAPFGERPDIWIEREGKIVAIRDAKGLIATGDSRKATYSLERWMEADGDLRPAKAARGSKLFQCDGQSCIALVKGKLISHVSHPSALADDCRRAAILIADFPLPAGCTQPELVIDSRDLREGGAQTLRVGEGRISVRTVAEDRGRRPWAIGYRRRQTIPAVAPDQEPEPEGGEATAAVEGVDMR